MKSYVAFAAWTAAVLFVGFLLGRFTELSPSPLVGSLAGYTAALLILSLRKR